MCPQGRSQSSQYRLVVLSTCRRDEPEMTRSSDGARWTGPAVRRARLSCDWGRSMRRLLRCGFRVGIWSYNRRSLHETLPSWKLVPTCLTTFRDVPPPESIGDVVGL